MSSRSADPGPGEQSDPSEVGTLGEEAVRLLEALTTWAGGAGAGSGREYVEAAAAAADGARAAWQRLDDHVATGSEECRYCPVCRMVSAARSTSPEVRRHLADAGSSLLHAAAGLLASTPPASQEQEDDRWA